MKKTILLTILMVSMCFMLLGCGKSEAVKKVEELIDGIGEVTVDSEESIKEAEEAYNALTDKEKEKVENADQLTLKKEALEECIARAKEEEEKKAKEAEEKERKEKVTPFSGRWSSLLMKDWIRGDNKVYTQDIIINDEDQYTKVNENNDAIKVAGYPLDELKIVDDNGINRLVADQGVFVRKSQYNEAMEKMFVHVALDEENISDYIGGPLEVGKYLNEWGDETDSKAYFLSSPAYENDGLIMIAYKDVKFEMYFKGNNDPATFYAPYDLGNGYGNPQLDHFGRVEGEIWYIREEFVDSISDGDSDGTRRITFTDGFSAEFAAPSVSGVNISITDLDF